MSKTGLRNSLILVIHAALLCTSCFCDTPQLNISLPVDGMMLRANVPVFGSVKMPRGSTDQLKIWYLEYGPGANPTTWVRLKESTELLPDDPWAAGKIKWDPNKEPPGNITNWAVGLQSYTYGNWRQNLNGLYTLRLVAETKKGKRSEIRQINFVGEAIMRTVGGTALSADGRCRLLIPPFAFDGELARVVTVVRQVPPKEKFFIPDLTGVEDDRKEAEKIYLTVPENAELMSAIYRIYPNGLALEPSGYLEIDYHSEAISGITDPSSTEGVTLRQFNPLSDRWEPLKTTWFEKTARAELSQISEYASYVALFRRKKGTVTRWDLTWRPKTALTGWWEGTIEPFATLQIKNSSKKYSATANAFGSIELPFKIDLNQPTYEATITPVEGPDFATTVKLSATQGVFTTTINPTLDILAQKNSTEDYLLVACSDESLKSKDTTLPRSILLRVVGSDRSGETQVELSESIPGSAIFTGTIKDSELIAASGQPLIEPLVIQAGHVLKEVTLPDTTAPQINLYSPTHPCFLFANVNTPTTLTSAQSHSQSRIQKEDFSWRISGIDDAPSARMTFWPIESFTPESWPIIGFTYRLYEPATWQLLIRQGSRFEGFHFGSNKDERYGLTIPRYGQSEDLKADGKWHFWQGNLTKPTNRRSPTQRQISQIAFGSWLQTGYYRIEPAFKGKNFTPLYVRELYIGKSYPSSLTTINWDIEDRSAIRKITWWVDREADSPPPEKITETNLANIIFNPSKNQNSVEFTLPADGRWFFHLQAEDINGNVSRKATYPIFVYSTEAKLPKIANPSESDLNPTEWSIPDGSIKIHLPNYGTAIDPKTLTLEILGYEFPITNPIWDAGSEILTLSPTSFKDGAPFGFNEEILSIKVKANDFQGNAITSLPTIPIKFKSPLNFSRAGDAIKIYLLSQESDDVWTAGWRFQEPPWHVFFPNSVNNVLSITRTRSVDITRRENQKWLRPIIIKSLSDTPLFEKESLNYPASDQISETEANNLPIIVSDSSTHNPEKAQLNGGGQFWAYKTEPTAQFRPQYARVISRNSSHLAAKIIPVTELKKILDYQEKETIRIDVWLPPGDGKFELHAPGERKMYQGNSWDRNWEKVAMNTLLVTSDSDWRKISILLVPKSNFINPKKSKVVANVYW